MKNIFVAATGQHVGKTTSTLGQVVNLRQNGLLQTGWAAVYQYRRRYCRQGRGTFF